MIGGGLAACSTKKTLLMRPQARLLRVCVHACMVLCTRICTFGRARCCSGDMVLLEILTAQRSKRRSGSIRLRYTLEMVRSASVSYSRILSISSRRTRLRSAPDRPFKATMRSDCGTAGLGPIFSASKILQPHAVGPPAICHNVHSC